MSVAAAIVEEAFFRRFVMGRVAGAGGGPVLEILASGVVFGCAHIIWGVVTGHWRTGLRVAAMTGTLGLALGVVFLLSDRLLPPVIVSHFLIDLVIHPASILAAFGGYMEPIPDDPEEPGE